MAHTTRAIMRRIKPKKLLGFVVTIVMFQFFISTVNNMCFRCLYYYVDQQYLRSTPVERVKEVMKNERWSPDLLDTAEKYSQDRNINDTVNPFKDMTYSMVLQEVATDDKVVVLAMVDVGVIDMAINFVITSVVPYQINNLLFISTSQTACQHLWSLHIRCYMYKEDANAQESSLFNTKDFLRKMNIRTDMIMDALKAGYKVLHTDVDMNYYANPFKTLSCDEEICDMIALPDTHNYNAGFLYINPSQNSISVYKAMQDMVKENSTKSDQDQLNIVVKEKKSADWSFHPFMFDKHAYQCGKFYYEDAQRYFADGLKECPECVVVHNNWIVSAEGKEYRSKELHQWMYDGGNYYSSTSRKYISYDNPLVGGCLQAKETETLSLALAIGQILNRTVILPKFHCSCSVCPLNSIVELIAFDKVFKGKYREHSFLSHPLVPDSVRNSIYGPIFFRSRFIEEQVPEFKMYSDQKHFVTIQPDDSVQGFTEDEIRKHFEDIPHSVIHFFSLYDSFMGFNYYQDKVAFSNDVTEGIIESNYRQYRPKKK